MKEKSVLVNPTLRFTETTDFLLKFSVSRARVLKWHPSLGISRFRRGMLRNFGPRGNVSVFFVEMPRSSRHLGSFGRAGTWFSNLRVGWSSSPPSEELPKKSLEMTPSGPLIKEDHLLTQVWISTCHKRWATGGRSLTLFVGHLLVTFQVFSCWSLLVPFFHFTLPFAYYLLPPHLLRHGEISFSFANCLFLTRNALNNFLFMVIWFRLLYLRLKFGLFFLRWQIGLVFLLIVPPRRKLDWSFLLTVSPSGSWIWSLLLTVAPPVSKETNRK